MTRDAFARVGLDHDTTKSLLFQQRDSKPGGTGSSRAKQKRYKASLVSVTKGKRALPFSPALTCFIRLRVLSDAVSSLVPVPVTKFGESGLARCRG
ncbi:hypothetical protein QR685DRAFT_285593 [Neurospora intermedia]|uniref:Uncharacterized protein n=1 Tax=Neurospora intermedia TaxID=5142 RepID=A0ABR3D9M3_NEUIN